MAKPNVGLTSQLWNQGNERGSGLLLPLPSSQGDVFLVSSRQNESPQRTRCLFTLTRKLHPTWAKSTASPLIVDASSAAGAPSTPDGRVLTSPIWMSSCRTQSGATVFLSPTAKRACTWRKIGGHIPERASLKPLSGSTIPADGRRFWRDIFWTRTRHRSAKDGSMCVPCRYWLRSPATGLTIASILRNSSTPCLLHMEEVINGGEGGMASEDMQEEINEDEGGIASLPIMSYIDFDMMDGAGVVHALRMHFNEGDKCGGSGWFSTIRDRATRKLIGFSDSFTSDDTIVTCVDDELMNSWVPHPDLPSTSLLIASTNCGGSYNGYADGEREKGSELLFFQAALYWAGLMACSHEHQVELLFTFVPKLHRDSFETFCDIPLKVRVDIRWRFLRKAFGRKLGLNDDILRHIAELDPAVIRFSHVPSQSENSSL
ncbi:uncharacterized protein EV422DRAFT_296483 [Fimicolochytrium jonesii]|uniref:uncharacterized protein n=1 Tax=Fimicolochytrium jonesii TaxID=1396493 RepID=UPI0022FE415D|nr:uncharacterized protein EV422DRAFT_296483 [Fimicolochytrium jonesii]KAI8816321.1 hypothetical protein EV422DRAFT_296483 [Fimicolochytrium jonesii]